MCERKFDFSFLCSSFASRTKIKYGEELNRMNDITNYITKSEREKLKFKANKMMWNFGVQWKSMQIIWAKNFSKSNFDIYSK
jgi:hypothetical protein